MAIPPLGQQRMMYKMFWMVLDGRTSSDLLMSGYSEE